jgi:hypothetical protein
MIRRCFLGTVNWLLLVHYRRVPNWKLTTQIELLGDFPKAIVLLTNKPHFGVKRMYCINVRLENFELI